MWINFVGKTLRQIIIIKRQIIQSVNIEETPTTKEHKEHKNYPIYLTQVNTGKKDDVSKLEQRKCAHAKQTKKTQSV